MKGSYLSKTFKQKSVEFFTDGNGLLSSKINCIGAGTDNKVYLGTEYGINVIENNKFTVSFPLGEVKSIFCKKSGEVYFALKNNLCEIKGNEIITIATLPGDITGIDGEDTVYAVTSDEIYELNENTAKLFYENWKPAKGLCVSNGKIREFADDSIMVFPGKRKHWRCIISAHSDMPDFKVNAIKFDNTTGFLYIATDKGLFIYDDHTGWYGHDKLSSLPCEEIFDIDIADNGKIALASEAGVITIYKGHTKYLPATRYVPVEKVNCVKINGDTIWAGTDEGLSKITEIDMTLAEKAEYFQNLANKYYFRKGFVVGLERCKNDGPQDGRPHISDNDGLWTHMYMAALCYKYAVTKDEATLSQARECLNAMLYLTKVSGIKGFTARAVRFEGEDGFGTKLDLPIDGGEWHKSPVYDCEWLGETSSDEMTGHFMGFSVYYELCANDEEKELIREAVCNMTDHIIEHNYRLYDCDNLPTTWACWDPKELNGNNMWLWEKCVNSLEILTFLEVAYQVSGDEKYMKEFRHLAFDEHYLINAAQHKKEDGHDTHIDDNLAMQCTATLLRIEKDEAIKSYIYMGLKHHWDYERIEHFAMWNFIYGAFIDEPCDIDTAVKYLRDMPLNPVCKIMLNNKRRSLVFDEESKIWGIPQQLKEPLDIDERSFGTYSDNPFTVNSGSGRGAHNPSSYLLPYWFARYYGILEG